MSRSACSGRQPDGDGRALLLTWAGRPDVAAVRFEKLAADGQAQAEPRNLLGCRVRRTTKRFKDAICMPQRHADARVGHPEPEPIRFGLQLDPNLCADWR